MRLSINLFIDMGAKEEHLQGDPQSCLFQRVVGIFYLIFLNNFLTKSCAYQKGNFPNFSKLTLLLSILYSWYPLRPVKHKRGDGTEWCNRHIVTDTKKQKGKGIHTEICIILIHDDPHAEYY